MNRLWISLLLSNVFPSAASAQDVASSVACLDNEGALLVRV